MAATNDNKDRQVVPRWRTFREALASNELSSTSVLKSPKIDATEFIREKEDDWKANKAIPFALDLISAATVLGKTDVSIEAAEFILENEAGTSATGKDIARSLLGIKEPASPIINPQSRIQIIEGLKELKQKRISQGKNAFVWVDLARLYTILGQNNQARQALRIALMLAPSERFVLRSTVRFLHHIDENEEAVSLLRKTPRTLEDPWLMAAEIAASGVAETTPRFAKQGALFLDKADIHRFHTSELASALATLEMRAGKHRHSNKLFRASLFNPTQNALAQAVWANKKAGLDAINPELLVQAHASEAITLDYFNRGAWQEVLIGAEKWAEEESFSPRPHGLASSVASSLLDRPDQAEKIADKGLEANPTNPVLLNNKAFAQIIQGKVTEAITTLKKVDLHTANRFSHICILATTGLAAFRLGEHAEGRRYYQTAISMADAPEDFGLKTLASLYLAREEVALGNKEGFADFKRAFKAAEKLQNTNIPAIAEHLAFDIEKAAARQDISFKIDKPTKPILIECDFFAQKGQSIIRRK